MPHDAAQTTHTAQHHGPTCASTACLASGKERTHDATHEQVAGAPVATDPAPPAQERAHESPEQRETECHIDAPVLAVRVVWRPRWSHLGGLRGFAWH